MLNLHDRDAMLSYSAPSVFSAVDLTASPWRGWLIVVAMLLTITPRIGFAQPAQPSQRPPNVIVVLCDDLGYSDVGCYGSEILTPNLDQLARSGRRFSQFYNTARCWPTRAALLTGYYAQQVRRDTVAGVPSGGQGKRPAWAKLLPERLRAFGYRSYHSGKWHVDGLPTQNGFEHSYSLQDHDRHFQPKVHTLDDKPLPAVTSGEAYYSSAAIADHTLRQLQSHREQSPDRPFFAFVAFTAPHFPLHAPAEAIERCRERYRLGWDAMRLQRWGRMSDPALGPAPSGMERDIGPPYAFPKAMEALGPGEVNRPIPWDELSEPQRAFQIDKMATHAAMIECMDAEIGRILDSLRQSGEWENTCIFFLSDNGASAEIMVRGDGHRADAPAGSAESFLCLGPGWSSFCNTPFRRHKTWVHEGGIATPMIAHWPAGISPAEAPITTPAHVIDLAPTILELAAGSKPADETRLQSPQWEGPAPPGISLCDVLTSPVLLRSTVPSTGAPGAEDAPIDERPLWWQHEGNRALRLGNWKLVAAGPKADWELYDLSVDRTEQHDLASSRPEDVERMAKQWSTMRDQFANDAKQVDAPK